MKMNDLHWFLPTFKADIQKDIPPWKTMASYTVAYAEEFLVFIVPLSHQTILPLLNQMAKTMKSRKDKDANKQIDEI